MGEPRNAFEDSRQRFHDLSGRLTVIFTALNLIRDADAGQLTEYQLQLLDRVDSATQGLLTDLRATADQILMALATAPASGKIWECPCLDGDRPIAALLASQVQALHQHANLPIDAAVVIVAASPRLAALREAFAALNCRVRIITAPADLRSLIEQGQTDLVALAPPRDVTNDWWRVVRLTLGDLGALPLLLALTPVQSY